jgi:hypothetical protein
MRRHAHNRIQAAVAVAGYSQRRYLFRNVRHERRYTRDVGRVRRLRDTPGDHPVDRSRIDLGALEDAFEHQRQ